LNGIPTNSRPMIAKLETSLRTTDLRKVPVEELRRGIQEILRHLGE
jgi:hypothetical protein